MKLDWKKIAFILLLVGIAGYKYYTSNIAAPQVAETETNQSGNGDYEVKFDEKKAGNDSQSKNDLKFKPLNNSNSQNSKPYLTSGRNRESPAGLVYGMGGGGEHRTDHVLRHAKDQPNRPSHGVFEAQGDDLFRLIDEAYELVKSKSRQVKSEKSRGNMAHVIDMKRKVGYKGGESGKRAGHPALYKIKLILADGNRVITAYPY